MERDKEVTIVLFRRERTKDFEVTAIFPEIPADLNGEFMSGYTHVGQHVTCGWIWYHQTKRATIPEYAALKRELEQLGYNLEVRHRMSFRMRAKRRENARQENQMFKSA